MNKQKLLSLIGFCKRSGNLSLGTTQVERSIQKKKARLIFFTSDISDGTKKRFENIASENKIDVLSIDLSSTDLLIHTSYKKVVVFSINDKGFCNSFNKVIIEKEVSNE